ncbi:MAG: DUF4082 domain-containing protein, partial [Acidimicrobiia bacterium]|nr:DUF4082 domain-containing protein [Acidimicrobiia bacterium]
SAGGAQVDTRAEALWELNVTPAIPNWDDPSAGTTGVELGTRFTTSIDVDISGVRFYKGDRNIGPHQGSLWLSDGTLVATGTFNGETNEGWQDLTFTQPVRAHPGQVYIASYFSPTANYSAENNYFTSPRTVGPITALGGANGVYNYGNSTAFPTFSYLSSTYWVTPLWSTNKPPVVDAGAGTSGTEGSPTALHGTVTDPDGDPVITSWSVVTGPEDAGGTCTIADPTVVDTSLTCSDDGPVTLSLSADDGHHVAVVDYVVVQVANAAPVVSGLTLSSASRADGSPIPVTETVNLRAAVTDPGLNDALRCSMSWGDGAVSDAPVAGGACAGNHLYTSSGVYTVVTTATDDDGGSASAEALLVIFDPSAGFVTGGGWIQSPAGAYRPAPDAAGKASFGFVSKYKKGSTVPSGVATFTLHTAGFLFQADSFDWLVVTGGTKAMFHGTGSIDGVGNHYFQLWADDAKPDTFRIKIWRLSSTGTEEVVYDNGVKQALGGGQIVVHS